MRGAVGVINGVDEGQERVRVRIQAGTPRVLVGILAVVVVHGVGDPVGIYELCNL